MLEAALPRPQVRGHCCTMSRTTRKYEAKPFSRMMASSWSRRCAHVGPHAAVAAHGALFAEPAQLAEGLLVGQPLERREDEARADDAVAGRPLDDRLRVGDRLGHGGEEARELLRRRIPVAGLGPLGGRHVFQSRVQVDGAQQRVETFVGIVEEHRVGHGSRGDAAVPREPGRPGEGLAPGELCEEVCRAHFPGRPRVRSRPSGPRQPLEHLGPVGEDRETFPAVRGEV